MSTDEPEKNPYELLNVGLEATEQEIKSAYRKLSLKVHPDRNPNNPDAAQKFHELNQAYELLLDPLRRLALTSSMRVKEARKARFTKYDKKRKNLQEELEERERAFKKQKVDKAKEEQVRVQENERIKEAGRKLREEKEEALKKQIEAEALHTEEQEDEDEVPPARYISVFTMYFTVVDSFPFAGQLDTTIKLKYSLSSHPTFITASALSELLSQFGEIDSPSIVLSLKPPKKAQTKLPKSGIALVPFKKIGGAFAAVCASNRKERGLEGVDIMWAEGREPPILGWLKKLGKLGAEPLDSKTKASSTSSPIATQSDLFLKSPKSTSSSAFSSFPDSFPSAPDIPVSQMLPSNPPALDYESLTLMRLRQAERERLEREIREQETNE
ncbi:hypothetical protein EW145_g6074 [Phellinidium pouzarii]|uniref:J domain-containing protein n=1 Tax=Phellinidium pouzarii TaxID=167371 RepID=A0A4S4KY20_9AGAM|nr:hypothetical protein EW145_g6074 [Phellinidium pouzarii]